LISVIVPAYNAENTLKYTLMDIKNQSYPDYELILVDDGSNDRTPAICDEAASGDSRIRVIHQGNIGPSGARNRGVLAARGQYISFIDSDDRIEPYYLEYLVHAIEESGARIAAGCIDRVPEGYSLTEKRMEYGLRVLQGKKALGEMFTGRRMTVGPYCKLVPRDIMLKYSYPEGKCYEDLSTTWRIILEEKKTACVDTVLYHYCMRGGSITGRKITTRTQCLDYYTAIRTCYRGIMKECPELKRDVAVLVERECMALYLSMRRCHEREPLFKIINESISRWMKKNRLTALRNNKAATELRLRIFLFSISPILYERLYYIGIRFRRKKLG